VPVHDAPQVGCTIVLAVQCIPQRRAPSAAGGERREKKKKKKEEEGVEEDRTQYP